MVDKRNDIPSVDDVADFFLLCGKYHSMDPMTHTKLQKLCYFAQGWHLASYNESLFHEDIEAWHYGPVVPKLYERFKQYKGGAINEDDIINDTMKDDLRLNEKNKVILRDVWRGYGSMSTKQIMKLSHEHDIWRKAYDDGNNVMAQEDIRHYFLEINERPCE